MRLTLGSLFSAAAPVAATALVGRFGTTGSATTFVTLHRFTIRLGALHHLGAALTRAALHGSARLFSAVSHTGAFIASVLGDAGQSTTGTRFREGVAGCLETACHQQGGKKSGDTDFLIRQFQHQQSS
jgi:hypothetical protein